MIHDAAAAGRDPPCRARRCNDRATLAESGNLEVFDVTSRAE